MRIAIHQPNYLPWIGFFDKLDQVDRFVLLDTAQYSKGNFINRNQIKSPQGALPLTVPIKNKLKPINELVIDHQRKWQVQHWKSIEANYKKAPYWSMYKDGFEKIYLQKWDQLAPLNIALIRHISSILNIKTEIFIESEFNIDFGKNNNRNVNIVSHLGGTVYVSGTGAKTYNKPDEFSERGIQLIYQDFKHPVYPQRFGKFESHLSIIDLIFNCGPESIKMIRMQRE
ncbi:WbqC-like protein OS=Ureibacillus acetophenoni OX=614649 GN=SAMN05877842_104124 PE=4 SV=1 [Ureibacillus acetophenoni]